MCTYKREPLYIVQIINIYFKKIKLKFNILHIRRFKMGQL